MARLIFVHVFLIKKYILQCKDCLQIVVTDKQTNKHIPNAKVFNTYRKLLFSNQKTQATTLSVQQQVTLRAFKKKYI